MDKTIEEMLKDFYANNRVWPKSDLPLFMDIFILRVQAETREVVLDRVMERVEKAKGFCDVNQKLGKLANGVKLMDVILEEVRAMKQTPPETGGTDMV